ncbi:Uncharacterised protein [Mycobacteroides abscessus subsp. abscessus]|nr:Uncharacterised protein [Mycobacteroides abscessus subsp. abscessus]
MTRLKWMWWAGYTIFGLRISWTLTGVQYSAEWKAKLNITQILLSYQFARAATQLDTRTWLLKQGINSSLI